MGTLQKINIRLSNGFVTAKSGYNFKIYSLISFKTKIFPSSLIKGITCMITLFTQITMYVFHTSCVHIVLKIERNKFMKVTKPF